MAAFGSSAIVVGANVSTRDASNPNGLMVMHFPVLHAWRANISVGASCSVAFERG
jgi:hypothetical protein